MTSAVLAAAALLAYVSRVGTVTALVVSEH